MVSVGVATIGLCRFLFPSEGQLAHVTGHPRPAFFCYWLGHSGDVKEPFGAQPGPPYNGSPWRNAPASLGREAVSKDKAVRSKKTEEGWGTTAGRKDKDGPPGPG